MAKSEASESEFEEEEERNVEKGISDYEKQRLSRIAENRARMEALGLHKMASSLMASSAPKSIHRLKSGQRKGKTKLVDYDDDYRPGDDDDDDHPDDQDDDDDDDDDDEDEDEDFVGQSSSKSRRNKAKSKVSKPNKKAPVQKLFSGTDYIDEEEVDDDELMQAISLSLQDSTQDVIFKERKENANVLEDARRKRKKSSVKLNSRVQMTEDELVLHFFQFDEEGRGLLTVRDLQRLATAHDFPWTDGELADMIHFFDSDGDGKLTLDDFRKIAGRCNMLRGSENLR